ncbi:regulator of ribosome synthesis, putative [Ixodes scapularis]|uniref:Ribosome biogenesis regulatory protein n=2 Tax=Ixodes scapularis TaxID=6945 RepID=B7PAK8_IXOSC|nr:regulator of ribosome synthesis, putative [Ixodes scapularis]|eukprot:XP_002406973.1 regulator of ribosome synthesis, putative [Ixodes scapularis]
MAALAEKILLEAAEKDALYKPTYVEKDLDLAFDLGTLLATDPNPLDAQKLRSESREEYLTELARGNTQLLINKLFELPTERVEDVIVAKLPDGTTRLPREKPVTEAHPHSLMFCWYKSSIKVVVKWGNGTNLSENARGPHLRQILGEFSKSRFKGPHSLPPPTPVYSEACPGCQRAQQASRRRKREWGSGFILCLPKNLFPPTENLSKDQVATAVTLAKSSTASHGKFAGTLKEEKNVRVRKAKRKASLLFSLLQDEKASQLKVLDEMARKKPKLDINQAVNHFIHDEEVK